MSNTRACVNVKISEKWLIEAPRLSRSLDSNRGCLRPVPPTRIELLPPFVRAASGLIGIAPGGSVNGIGGGRAYPGSPSRLQRRIIQPLNCLVCQNQEKSVTVRQDIVPTPHITITGSLSASPPRTCSSRLPGRSPGGYKGGAEINARQEPWLGWNRHPACYEWAIRPQARTGRSSTILDVPGSGILWALARNLHEWSGVLSGGAPWT